jgi:hypothetical protein
MVEAMFRKASAGDPEQLYRDKNTLVWTMKSLADDTELERFIDTIPDLVWGPNARRSTYYVDHIQSLIDDKDPNVSLLDRLKSLYKTCDTGLLNTELCNRRRISCFQATWALGSLATPDTSCNQTLFKHIISHAPVLDSDPRVLHYSISAVAMSRWGSFCAAQDALQETLVHLAACSSPAPVEKSKYKASQQKLLACLQRLKSYAILLNYPDDFDKLSSHMKRLTEDIGNPSTTIPFSILINYLVNASRLTSPPFRFEETQRCISPPISDEPLTKRWLEYLERRSEKVIYACMDQMNTKKDSVHWLDCIVHTMMSYWVPPENDAPTLPQAFLQYLNQRTSESAVKGAMESLQIGARGKRFIPATILRLTKALSEVSDDTKEYFYIQRTGQSLTELWAILCRAGPSLDLSSLHDIIDGVSGIDHPLMTSSIVALAKHKAITTLREDDPYFQKHTVARSSHPFLPTETATTTLGEEEATRYREDEGKLNILTKFIQDCLQSSEPLFKARETLEILGGFIPGETSGISYIHYKHQLHFTETIHSLVGASVDRQDWRAKILEAIFALPLFSAYVSRAGLASWAPTYTFQTAAAHPGLIGPAFNSHEQVPVFTAPFIPPFVPTPPFQKFGSTPPFQPLNPTPPFSLNPTPPFQPPPFQSFGSHGPYYMPQANLIPPHHPQAASTWSHVEPPNRAAQWLDNYRARRMLTQALGAYAQRLSPENASDLWLMALLRYIATTVGMGLQAEEDGSAVSAMRDDIIPVQEPDVHPRDEGVSDSGNDSTVPFILQPADNNYLYQEGHQASFTDARNGKDSSIIGYRQDWDRRPFRLGQNLASISEAHEAEQNAPAVSAMREDIVPVQKPDVHPRDEGVSDSGNDSTLPFILQPAENNFLHPEGHQASLTDERNGSDSSLIGYRQDWDRRPFRLDQNLASIPEAHETEDYIPGWKRPRSEEEVSFLSSMMELGSRHFDQRSDKGGGQDASQPSLSRSSWGTGVKSTILLPVSFQLRAPFSRVPNEHHRRRKDPLQIAPSTMPSPTKMRIMWISIPRPMKQGAISSARPLLCLLARPPLPYPPRSRP